MINGQKTQIHMKKGRKLKHHNLSVNLVFIILKAMHLTAKSIQMNANLKEFFLRTLSVYIITVQSH